jgi:hypothetical protein
MIDVRFDTDALTRVRFAISPMFETIASLKALDDPARGALHLSWVERTRCVTRDLDRVLHVDQCEDATLELDSRGLRPRSMSATSQAPSL